MDSTYPQVTVQAIEHSQHSLFKLIGLHLLPGLLTVVFYLLIARPVMSRGFPPMFAMLLAVIFITVPLELGELLRKGRARNGRASLKGIVNYLKPIPVLQYIVFTMGFLILALFLSGAAGVIDNAVGRALSPWLPSWFFMQDTAQYTGYTRNILMITLVVNLVLNGLVAPVVEELYFRGYLLPHLSRFGAKAPLIGSIFFTLYHFWQPYAYVSIFLVMAPLIYLVWRKQNIYLGIVAHCALNIVGNLMLFGAILSKLA